MVDLTPGPFLQPDLFGQAFWRSSEPIAPIPVHGLGLDPLDLSQVGEVTNWLSANLGDSDHELERRMDNWNDEFGRVRAALRGRIRLASPVDDSAAAGEGELGTRILVDARSLQTPSYSGRGIGRFARACVEAVRECVPDSQITLLIDRSLSPLSDELAGDCEQSTWISKRQAHRFGLLIQPSPLTHDPEPIASVLGGQAIALAVVFDFIPLHYPSVYLRFAGERAEYLRNLDALRLYNRYACISHTVRDELLTRLPSVDPASVSVAWPRAVGNEAKSPCGPGRNESIESVTDEYAPVVLAIGDDPRKNTFGGLAGIAAATSHQETRNVVVLGMNTGDDRVHHWSIAAAMRPGEATDFPRLTDQELEDLLASARCTVVPSFDEGLSLPVVEALSVGSPVVASDIPAHRELIGQGRFLFDPREPRSIAKAFDWVVAHPHVAKEQQRRLAQHEHVFLEEVIQHATQEAMSRGCETPTPATTRGAVSERTRMRVAVATPWPPQPSGVADYSATTIRALGELSDVTLFTTSGARVDLEGADSMIHAHHDVEDLLAEPERVAADFDAVVAVVGNSHFHLPFVTLLSRVECVVIAHDTRMTEYYLALRDRAGLRQVMLRTADPGSPRVIRPALDDQIVDLRLLQNAAMWEVANQAECLILHSPMSAPIIEQQTGVKPVVLPFAYYRSFDRDVDPRESRETARRRLGIDVNDTSLHLATFGYVDTRTKQVDTVVEAAGWLTTWGHAVSLHVVGSAHPETRQQLERRARELGLADFAITGYQDEPTYRDWLMAVDLGVQLRISPLLGVSGPLADMAAVGTSAVASGGLCRDVGAPDYICALPDAVSPVTLAQAVLAHRQAPWDPVSMRQERDRYLREHSPELYAKQLLQVLEDVIA